jgi:hypothetical protein
VPIERQQSFFAFVGTALLWQLPLYYVVAPSLFFSTILPHLPFFVVSSLLGAPSILIGGCRSFLKCRIETGWHDIPQLEGGNT